MREWRVDLAGEIREKTPSTRMAGQRAGRRGLEKDKRDRQADSTLVIVCLTRDRWMDAWLASWLDES
jgi:hypothetical protein